MIAIIYQVSNDAPLDPRIEELTVLAAQCSLSLPELFIQGLHAVTGFSMDELRAPPVTTNGWRYQLMAVPRSNLRLSDRDADFIAYALQMESIGVEDFQRVRSLIERARRAGYPAQRDLLDDDDVPFR